MTDMYEVRGLLPLSFDVVGRSTGTAVGYQLNVGYDEYPYKTSWLPHSLVAGAIVAASGVNAVISVVAVYWISS